MLEYTSKPVDSFRTDRYYYALVPMNGYNPPRYNVQIYRVRKLIDAFHIYQDQFHDWKEIAKDHVRKMH